MKLDDPAYVASQYRDSANLDGRVRIYELYDASPERLPRWMFPRLGLADGESKYGELEARLAVAPVIAVPTITLEGDANGAPHQDASSYAKKFSGKYEHRVIEGGIGHNLPQEAPQAFAEAILEVAKG